MDNAAPSDADVARLRLCGHLVDLQNAGVEFVQGVGENRPDLQPALDRIITAISNISLLTSSTTKALFQELHASLLDSSDQLRDGGSSQRVQDAIAELLPRVNDGLSVLAITCPGQLSVADLEG